MTSSKMIYFAALMVAVLANVSANISLKVAMTRLPSDSVKAAIFQLFERASFWIGFACAGILLSFYLIAIRNGPVSVAYILVTSLAMVGMVLVEYRFFGVPLGTTKLLGMALVIGGVLLVGRTQ